MKGAIDLKAFAGTAVGRQAIDELATLRATQRKAIIEKLAGEVAALEREEAEARAEVKLREGPVAEAHRAFVAAAQRLSDAQSRASTASYGKDVRRGRARRALEQLGQAAIEETRHSLRCELQQLLGVLNVVAVVDDFGAKTGERDRNPEATERLALVKAHLVELDQMEYADMTPAAIESRCTQMAAGAMSDEATERLPAIAVVQLSGTVTKRRAFG